MLSFATSAALQKGSVRGVRHRRCAPLCTLAPKRPSQAPSTNRTPAKSYRVLPDALPDDERPPLPPKHRSIPVVGFLLEYMLGLTKGLVAMREQYGSIYRADYFLFPQTYVSSYQAVADILNDSDVFLCSNSFQGTTALFGEEALTQVDGARHAALRAALAPAFTPALMPVYFTRVVERCRETWARVLDDVRSGKGVKLEPVFREHYLGITIEITTGIASNSDLAAELRELFGTMQLAFLSPPFGPLWDRGMRASRRILDILAGVVHKVVAERADIIAQLRAYGNDVTKLGLKDIANGDVDVLLVAIAEAGLPTEAGTQLDPVVVEKLCRQMLLLWFAGYATAAVTSSCAAFEAGWDEATLQALVAEQQALMDEEGGERNVTYKQTSKMPLLESFLSEILRTHPAATGLFRTTATDVEMLGKLIPKGSVVFASIKGAQCDPDVWPEPDVFDPMRFVPSIEKSRPPPLLAFGGTRSPHYCIGATLAKAMMKATFGTLLREYTYSLDPMQSRKYKMIPEEVPSSGVVLGSFEKRDV